MATAQRPDWTMAEFLAWEERQELRYEFDGQRVHAMTGGTGAHDAIQMRIVGELYARLRGKPCEVHGSSLKIEVMGSIRYPDAFVSCTPVSLSATIAPEPVVIFEVISKSTALTDRVVKNREYADTPSVKRYVMLEQAAIAGTMFERSAETGAWVGSLLRPDTVIAMPEIDVELPVADLYAGLDLPAVPDEE